MYKLNFTACRSCFHCKKIRSKYDGKCPIKDDLKPLLEDNIWDCDGLILGSPVYFASLSGQMRSFYERFLFPKFTYLKDTLLLLLKDFPIAAIYKYECGKRFSRS